MCDSLAGLDRVLGALERDCFYPFSIASLADAEYGDDVYVDRLFPALFAKRAEVQFRVNIAAPSPRFVRGLCEVIRRVDMNQVAVLLARLSASERADVMDALRFGTSFVVHACLGGSCSDGAERTCFNVSLLRQRWTFLLGSLPRNNCALSAFLARDRGRDVARHILSFLRPR